MAYIYYKASVEALLKLAAPSEYDFPLTSLEDPKPKQSSQHETRHLCGPGLIFIYQRYINKGIIFIA